MAADFFDMCDITEREANIELNKDPDVKAEKMKVAQEGEEIWRSIAPVGDPAKDPHSGQYKDSIHAFEGKHGGIGVMADAPNAWFVEYGTNGIHESACRARTEAILNKKYREAPKDGGEG